jgi:hypothetical protein
MSANNAIPPTPTVVLGCSKCGATLPEDAQFCLKCGKAVSTRKSPPEVEVLPPAVPVQRHKRQIWRWVIPILLIVFVLWVVFSGNPYAMGIQELVGVKQDAIILDAPFTVAAHSFRFYKVALPEGSVNVSVVGQFACDDSKDNNASGNIEVYILSESAFTIWQNGYATGSLYESGKVAKGDVNAELPAGAGIYYLVFSNKFSPKTPQPMHASFVLRYKSWMPDGIRRAKARFTNWLGL